MHSSVRLWSFTPRLPQPSGTFINHTLPKTSVRPQEIYKHAVIKNHVKDNPGVLVPRWYGSLTLCAWIIGQTTEEEGKPSHPPPPSLAQSLSQPCVLGGFHVLTYTSQFMACKELLCAIKGEMDLINPHRKKEPPGRTPQPPCWFYSPQQRGKY